MLPYFQKDNITLYYGKCDDVLPVLQEKATLIIADPPFNLNKEFDTPMTSEQYYAWCDSWISQCWQATTDNGSFFLMNIQEHIGEMMMSMKKHGTFRNQIIWFNSTMPVKNRFCIGYQPIIWYVKNIKDYIFNYGSEKRVSTAALPWGKKNHAHSLKDIWDDIPFISGGCMASKEAVLAQGTKKKAHPAQMPLHLAERMIQYCSNEGDLVVDPFAGSGTTLLSALALNRKCVGIEANKEYCDLIVSRLKNHQINTTKINFSRFRKNIHNKHFRTEFE